MSNKTQTRINHEIINDQPRSLRFIPRDEQTPAMRLACVRARPLDIKYVPFAEQTFQLKLTAVEGDFKAIRHITQPDERLCDAAIRQSEDAWDYISTGYEAWDGLMKHGAVALAHCPSRYRDTFMCRNAVYHDPMALAHVPEDKVTYSMCEQAWGNATEAEKPTLFRMIPETYRNPGFCREAIQIDPMLLEFVPQRVQEQNPRIVDAAIRLNPDSERFVLLDRPQPAMSM